MDDKTDFPLAGAWSNGKVATAHSRLPVTTQPGTRHLPPSTLTEGTGSEPPSSSAKPSPPNTAVARISSKEAMGTSWAPSTTTEANRGERLESFRSWAACLAGAWGNGKVATAHSRLPVTTQPGTRHLPPSTLTEGTGSEPPSSSAKPSPPNTAVAHRPGRESAQRRP